DFRLSRVRRWWLYYCRGIIMIPEPRAQRFLVTDPRIQQVDHDDHTNINRIAVIIATAVPLVAIIVWCSYKDRPFREYHHAILGLATAISFTSAVILSPGFIDICAPTPEVYRKAFLNCHGKLYHSMRYYPYVSSALSSSSMGYLGLYFSKELGLHLHPSVRQRLQRTNGYRGAEYSRPGQTLVWFVCILPYAAGMAYPAVQIEHRGGGRGWEVVCGIIIGTIFAVWGHVLYVADIIP
ncbi:hypothetical protein DL89DRAFT_263658, partial [Linderina pennispora]